MLELCKDYRYEKRYTLYADAQDFAREIVLTHLALVLPNAAYWVAWYAARRTADALLAEANAIGVTAEQWEALRKVAAHVAAD